MTNEGRMRHLLKCCLLLVMNLFMIGGFGRVVALDTLMQGDDSIKINSSKQTLSSVFKDSLHIRYCTETQEVHIWTNDLRVFHGTITNFTREYHNGMNCKKKEKEYRKTIKMDSNKALEMFRKMEELEIFSMHDSRSIIAWNGEVYDAMSYGISYSGNGFYAYQDFSAASIFKDKIPEAVVICSFANYMEENLHLSEIFSQFVSGLPYGCYHMGGYSFRCDYFNPVLIF